MTFKLRGDTYWMDVQINGVRHRESLKTDDKKQAQALYDIRRAELWQGRMLKAKPKKTFKEACARWLVEKAHKKSIQEDKDKINYFLPKLGERQLSSITRDDIEALLPQDVTSSTRNRYRALIGAMLRAAERDWEWIDRAPVLRSEAEPKKRVSFLSRDQAEALVASLPEKYRMPVRFALLTGLRRSNVFGLTWEKVDLERGIAVVEADEAKAGQRIVVPLNKAARELLASILSRARGACGATLPASGATPGRRPARRLECPVFAFTTCATPGRAGTPWRARRCRCCRSWAAGTATRWCSAMRTWRRST